jgi:hypothetical protein
VSSVAQCISAALRSALQFDTWYKGKASDAKMSAAQKIDVFMQAMLIASTVVPDTLPDAAKPEAHAIASLFKVKRRVEACVRLVDFASLPARSRLESAVYAGQRHRTATGRRQLYLAVLNFVL